MTVKPRSWWIFGFTALLGIFIWFKLSYSQFSAVNLTVDKNQASQIAENYLANVHQINVSQFKKAIVFITDTDADRYLQKSIGFDREGGFLKEHDFDLFLWLIRFFKENEKEEFRLTVSAATGQITSLRHTINDSDARETLTESAAQEKAVQFLRQNFGFDQNQYTLHTNQQRRLERRIDFTFSWEKNNVAIPWSAEPSSGKAKLLTGATVSGNEILSFFKNTLEIPDQFSRHIEKKKHTGRRLNFAFFVIYLFVLTGTVFFVIARRNHLAMHVAKKFCIGLAATLFVLNVLFSLNDFQSILFGYDSTVSLRSYLSNHFSELIFYTFLLTVSILMPSLAGESLHRELQKKKDRGSFLHYITSSFFSRHVTEMILLGYLTAVILIGFQTAIFEAGYRYFGVWIERDWITQLSSTYLPFCSAFIISFRASIMEEITFRIFTINWLKKFTHSTLLAVIISSLAWGFGHGNYLIFPMWFRGIEITCLGLILAYVYLEYGIIPALVAHYLLDAFWGTAGYLWGKSNPLDFYGSFAVLLFPLLWATAAFLFNRTNTEQEFRWKLNKDQLYNLNILRDFLAGKKMAGAENPETVRRELIAHGWDAAVVDTALADLNQPGHP